MAARIVAFGLKRKKVKTLAVLAEMKVAPHMTDMIMMLIIIKIRDSLCPMLKRQLINFRNIIKLIYRL